MMPPQGSPQPDAEARTALVSYLTTTLDREAAAHPNPGRPLVHRLNRAEYSNAIRDLLALDVDASALLPPDDAAYGFDNIADALGVSPVLLERYLAAAGKISSLAVGDPDTGPAGEVFRIRQDASQDIHIEGLPVGTVGRDPRENDAAARRHVRFFDQAVPHEPRRRARPRVRTPARIHSGRHPRPRVARRRRGGLPRQPEEHDEGGRRRGGAGARPHPAQGRPARDHRGVPRAERRDQPAAAPAVHPQFERHAGHDRASASRYLHADGAVQRDGPGRHAEPPQDLHLPSVSDRDGRRLRPPHRLDARAACVPRAGEQRRSRAPARVLPEGAEAGFIRNRHPDGPAAHSCQPEVLVPGRARPRRRGAGADVPHQRPRARVAPVVLPLEQHSGRPAAPRRGPGHAAHAGGAHAAGAAHAGRREGRSARFQLRGPVALPAQPEEPAAELAGVPRLRRQPASGVPARNRAVLPEHPAGRQKRPRPAERRLHVPQRTAREALRRAQHLRQPLSSRHARRRCAQGAPRQGRHPDGHFARGQDLAGRARQVGARQPSERAGAADAEQRAAAQRRREPRRQDPDDARAHGRAPQEPGLRGVPQDHGSHRAVDGELRRRRRVAHPRWRHAREPHQRVGRAARRHEGGRRGDAARRRCCASPISSSARWPRS